MLLYPFRHALHKRAEVFVEDMLHLQELIHPGEIGNRPKRAEEEHSVQSRENTDNPLFVPLQELLHDGRLQRQTGKYYHHAA